MIIKIGIKNINGEMSPVTGKVGILVADISVVGVGVSDNVVVGVKLVCPVGVGVEVDV